MKRSIQILVIGALVTLLTILSSAQVPQMINYQGKLTNASGAPVNDTVQMVFSIYSDTGGTNLLWTETQPAVVVEKGVFNVLLGTVNPIPDSVFNGNVRYLGVKVGGDPEITPRKPMVSVAYAMRAGVGGGGADNDWTFRITDGNDTTLMTGGAWGIARYGNTLYGNADSTHVNLGVACTTGANGQNIKYCTVGGGRFNTAKSLAIVGGGEFNTASGIASTVAGGGTNTASGDLSTVAGGGSNIASGERATVGGGVYNTASGYTATVGGGYGNTASSENGTVGGGKNNTASGISATAGGGYNNTASGHDATVGGGALNTASGGYAIVPGGVFNTAVGDYSFAAGRRAKANHSGTFIWADGTDADFASTGENQFLIRASGGIGIGTASPTAKLDVNGSTGYNQIRMRTSYTPTGTNDANGNVGDIAWDDNYIYVKTSAGWKRAALSTW